MGGVLRHWIASDDLRSQARTATMLTSRQRVGTPQPRVLRGLQAHLDAPLLAAGSTHVSAAGTLVSPVAAPARPLARRRPSASYQAGCPGRRHSLLRFRSPETYFISPPKLNMLALDPPSKRCLYHGIIETETVISVTTGTRITEHRW